ncbi:MAG: hypothetical protein A2020_01095 [Lentisphaerae bacterium GWF2_45_14]|nr:MAG: hypothetical protein A2020_01095 [Lentisphaerae bacterium GWF2_45_14]
MGNDEIFEIVNQDGAVIGTAPRSECHGNPALVHRCAHVVVYHPDGRILLQKRSAAKDIQPGKWDTAVGGHLQVGEDFESGARREMNEELGLDPAVPLEFLFDSKIRNDIESEKVRVFSVVSSGPFQFDRDEVSEVRFWTVSELKDSLERDDFTPNLKAELKKLLGSNE